MKKINRILKASGGFTLIELVTAIALFSIIITTLTMVTVRGMTSFYHEQEKIELMEAGQFSLRKISNQIRLSKSRVTSGDNYISVSMYDTATLECVDYTYKLPSGSDQLKEYIRGSSIGNMIAENLSDFTVIKDGKLLRIEIELTGPKYGEVVNLKTSIYLRNQAGVPLREK